jgi:hypothetical protein
MFGHHDLYRDGVPARSVVISVLEGAETGHGHAKHEHMVNSRDASREQHGQQVFYDVVADVDFGDGTITQHRERLWRDQVGECSVGDVLPVRYDRQHRDKIVFDLPELETNRYSPKERADGQPHVRGITAFLRDEQAIQAQARAHAAEVSADSMQNLLSTLAADPQGFRDRVRQLAQESGTNTFVFTSTSADQNETPSGFPAVDLTDDEVEDI